MQEKLRAQYKIGMAHFEQKYALWNSGGAASNRVLSNKEVADYMNAIVRKSDIEADDGGYLRQLHQNRPIQSFPYRQR